MRNINTKLSRRILLINHYAGAPDYGMEYRTYHFAREWVKAGHAVMIIGAGFSHLRRENPKINKHIAIEKIDGINYLWVRTPSYSGNGVKRAINMACFIAGLFTNCRRYITDFKPELVIASSTYTWDNWPACYYARKHKAHYVYELHDIWPLTLIEAGGMSRCNPFVWSLQCAENFACRNADKVISLLPAAQPHLIAHGMREERFVHIPNGILEEEWRNALPVPQEHHEKIHDFRKFNKYLIGYVGGHNTLDPLEPLIDVARNSSVSDIGFVLVGNGTKKEALMKQADKLGHRVLFLPAVPKTCVPSILKMFDLLFLGFPKSTLYRFGISPNKLYEYMMSGVPILFSGQVANDPVKECGSGITVEPENSSAICRGIAELIALDENARRTMGVKGQQYVRERHFVSHLAQQFLNAVWPEDRLEDGGTRSRF